MKIAISSSGDRQESQIDFRFGRCPFFAVVEAEGGEIKSFRVVRNEAASMGGGAGISAAQTVANERPDAVITVNMGPRAFDVLSRLGIKIYRGSGTVESAVKDLLEGKLQTLESASGPMNAGRHGKGWE